jgi:hypothetical protein
VARLALVVAALLIVPVLPADAAVGDAKVNLRVLVVSDGGPAVEAIATELDREGVPFTKILLSAAGRPVIDAAYLASPGAPATAKFQSVVLPNENPFAAGSAEMAALVAYEKQYEIRQVDAYTWANPAVGLNYAGYVGTLDGTTGAVSAAGKTSGFGYLNGPVPFEDNSTSVVESYGYLASPLADDPATASHFEPLVTGVSPDGATTGSLVGAYTHDGRSELVVNFVYNAAQQQFRVLAHGMITWMTKGVHFGYDRNYFSVHVDDIFAADSRWSMDANCTPGDGCPIGADGESTVQTADIRMTAADVQNAVAWQAANGLTLDLLFNGQGSVDYAAANGADPLLTEFKAQKSQFRWTNHTYTHLFLGCEQNFAVVPWQCVKNTNGTTKWVTRATIQSQITQNRTFASTNGLSVPNNELVTGEHSGFFILPQQPQDNPNLASGFTNTGIAWAGTDNSRDPVQRKVGSALTVPRYPINIFFNVATKAEEVDEYNWIYTSRADGGSGICEDNPGTTTCITPLTAAQFDSYLVPLEARNALSHVLQNDPRPHYVHQSNLTEDRVIYPVLDQVVGQYKTIFAANAPIVNPRLSAAGTRIQQQNNWKSLVQAGTVSGYVRSGKVTVTGPSLSVVPITTPEGTRAGTSILAAAFGEKYAGERSAWQSVPLLSRTFTLTLPA